MNTTSQNCKTILLGTAVACLCLHHGTASTVTGPHAFASDPILGGISYTWTVQMGGTDSATFSRHVG